MTKKPKPSRVKLYFVEERDLFEAKCEFCKDSKRISKVGKRMLWCNRCEKNTIGFGVLVKWA